MVDHVRFQKEYKRQLKAIEKAARQQEKPMKKTKPPETPVSVDERVAELERLTETQAQLLAELTMKVSSLSQEVNVYKDAKHTA